MSERIRRNVLNRRESNAHNARAFAICDRFGLSYDIDHIFGLPDETEADHIFAARFYSGLRKLNRLKCHHLTIFPRTRMVEIAHERGMVTSQDVENLEQGRTGDFFHVAAVEAKERLAGTGDRGSPRGVPHQGALGRDASALHPLRD